MRDQEPIKIQRRPEVLTRTGFSKTTLQTRINAGIFVPPISLGERAVGFVCGEVTAMIKAMVAGRSKEELKEIVSALIEQRQPSQEECHEH